MTAVRTSVLIDQFEIGDNGITHKPTGWRFTAYQDSPTDGTVIMGRLGDKLETGEDFHPHEVEEMARRLWASKREKNGADARPLSRLSLVAVGVYRGLA